MRITNQMMVNNAISNMADNLERVNKLQNKLTTGKDFSVPSENPTHASASLSLRSYLQSLKTYSETAANTKNWMTATDNVFDQLNEVYNRANQLILKGLTDSYSGSERANDMATEMQSLVKQAVDLGNTTLNGQYLFSGYQVNQKAFDLTDSATTLNDYQGNPFTPQTAAYLGDAGNMQRALGPDQSITLNVRGDDAILGVIQNLILAANALKQNNTKDTGNPATDPLTLQSVLTSLKDSVDVMNQSRTANGTRIRQVEAAASFLESVTTETKGLLSENEDTNMAEGIALLTNQQTTYQAVLEVSQRALTQLSLFDYLR